MVSLARAANVDAKDGTPAAFVKLSGDQVLPTVGPSLVCYLWLVRANGGALLDSDANFALSVPLSGATVSSACASLTNGRSPVSFLTPSASEVAALVRVQERTHAILFDCNDLYIVGFVGGQAKWAVTVNNMQAPLNTIDEEWFAVRWLDLIGFDGRRLP